MEIENDIITNDGEDIFQIRLIKSEGIGLITSKSGKNFLILDSSDFWYDCIQTGYPKIKKCSCKNDRFKLKFKYFYRKHYKDIKQIEIKTLCINCGKLKTVLDIDIKYSPTDHLIKSPLFYCKNPNIKYNNKTLSHILTLDEFHNNFFYLFEIGLNIYCWYFNKNKREMKIISKEEIEKIGNFLKIYITQGKINIEDYISATDELGIYMNENLWRKNEIIEVASVNIVDKGINYILEYSTQFIDKNGEVVNKTKEFTEKIKNYEKWFNENYRK